MFEIGKSDTVWDAWLATTNLVDMLEQTQRLGGAYDFAQARDKIDRVYLVAQAHEIDRCRCACGLSDAEHALLRRKIMTFFCLQLSNLKRFLDPSE